MIYLLFIISSYKWQRRYSKTQVLLNGFEWGFYDRIGYYIKEGIYVVYKGRGQKLVKNMRRQNK